MQQVVILEQRLEQPEILTGSWVEAGIASPSDDFAFGEPFYLLVGRRRVVNDRESFQVPVGGGSVRVFEMRENDSGFVHRSAKEEILAANLTRMVHEGGEMVIATEGKVSLENDSIEAIQSFYNSGRKLLVELVHGVLLRVAVLQPSIVRDERLFSSNGRTTFHEYDNRGVAAL